MAKLNNGPTNPPIPSEEVYGPASLQLFARHNRETFLATFGQQAPKWDKSRPIKRWFDTTLEPGTKVTYSVFNDAKKGFQQLPMTAEEAALINLPGTVAYPKHVVAPTAARIVSASGAFPMNATLLSTQDEANNLAVVIMGSDGRVAESDAFAAGNFSIDWGTETRRAWVIFSASNPTVRYSVAGLLKQQFANGVGSPGTWIFPFTAQVPPVWAPEAPGDAGEQDPRPEVPIPVRSLLPNEAVKPNFLGTVYIYRTDKDNPFTNTVNNSGGGLTEAQAKTLASISANVDVLLALAKSEAE